MRKTTKNTFSDGLNLDLHPIVTPNTVLTDNLNGTFITYNGNEFCLQNDRGNTKVAGLEDGFIPIGAKQYGGVIYIVSTNNNNLTEIGTYPGVDWTNEEGILNYNAYAPLGNLYTDSTYETKVEDGFRFSAPYSTKHPVTIEVQPSYDGSVNLVIIADKIKPIIINSGFSVLPENRYKLIDREQSVDTNKYSLDRLSEQLNLIRESFEITNIDLVGVNSGGQLKGGNYKFYIKFGDADYNQTDVVAESGIVSIFHGNDGVASTIYGTILDERTDKMVGLFITGLNHVYSKIYVYYSREYSDTNGYRMTEFGMLNEPIDMVSEDSEERRPVGSHIDTATGATVTDTIGGQIIWITGFEQEVPIDKNELNVDYHTVDFARAEAQQANMLFLGNIGRSEETFDTYRQLKEATLNFEIGISKYSELTNDTEQDLYTDRLYYDINTLYNYLGYYPGEMYRFGIVYVFKDGSTSPVFNTKGGKFILNEQNKFDLDTNYYNNIYDTGVIIMPDENEFPIFESSTEDQNKVSAIGLSFTAPTIDYKKYNVIGWFVVRQKRIPNVVCQGLSAKVDRRSHTPVIYDGSNWISQSFISLNRNKNEVDDAKLRYDNSVYSIGSEGIDFEAWLNEMGYTIDNSNISLKKYVSTIVISFLTPDKAAQALYNRTIGNVNTHFWMSEAYPYNTLLEFQNYIRANNIKQLYQTKYNVYVDGIIKKAEKGNDRHEIEITYWSASNDTPTFIYIDPNINHKSNYYGFDAGSYPVNDVENQYWDEYEEFIQKYGGSVKNKIIKESPNSEQVYDCFSSDALISLDPCVNPTVKSILNGSEFYIQKSYDVSVKGFESSGYYQYYSNTFDNVVASKTKAVFIDSDTAIKVVDNASYSTLAGDATDVSRYSYFATPYFVNRGDESNDSYKQANNINILRGKFCPYIGILSNDFSTNSVGIYTIKQKELFDEQDVLVRANDNSEYYCVSKRFLFNDSVIKSNNVFGGDCFISTITIRIIRNFIDPEVPISENIIAPNSWQENVASKYYTNETESREQEDLVDFDNVNRADVNTVDLGMWVTFRCLSNYNLGLRSKDYSHVDEMSIMGSPRTFHPVNSASTATGAKIEESLLLNDGYNSTVGRKSYNLLPDVPYTNSEFSNRIMFSNVNVTDSYSNGYRTFQGLSYKDYDKQYGPITKLISWGNNLLCVMEHGIGLVAVNEKALLQTTTGEAIHIYGHGVLSDTMQMVSQTYGSKYEHSVIRTPIGVYGIDTDARKVWRVTDKGFETISDMKIESYLNDNLFTDIDSNIQTIDVRTHYNSFKGDIMFTFYNTEYPYLITADYIELYKDEQVLINIKTNQDDLNYEISNSGVIELIDNKYVKGLEIGNAILTIYNDNLRNEINIKVKEMKSEDVTPVKKYLDGLSNSYTIRVNDEIVYSFEEAIDPTQLIVTHNSRVLRITKSEDKLVIKGVSEGKNNITLSYNGEYRTCSIIVLPVEEQIDSEDESVEEYFTVYLHGPVLNTQYGDVYQGESSVFVTYNGERTEYQFNGLLIKKLIIKKKSSILVECEVPNYKPFSREYIITKNNTNIYPVIGEFNAITITSINAENAKITINDHEVSVNEPVLLEKYSFAVINASANGYMDYTESFQVINDTDVNLVLDAGEFYLKFSVQCDRINSDGSYRAGGIPSGITLDYEITRGEQIITGTRDINRGLKIPLCTGDNVSYTLSAPNFDSIHATRENVLSEQIIRYWMEESGYHAFRIRNIPNGYKFINIQPDGVDSEGIMWDSNVLRFKAGRILEIRPVGYNQFSYTMPDHDVVLNISANLL